MLSSCKFEGSESSEVQRQFSWKTGEIGSSRRAILSPLDGSPRARDVLFLPALILVFAVVRLHAVGKASQDHIKHSIEGLQV